MKKKLIFCVAFLSILLFNQLGLQATTESNCVVFEDSIIKNATFEWVVEKYEVELRPEPTANMFFEEGDILKAKIIATPPVDLESWEYFRPDANFSNWIEFYNNDVIFEPDTIGNLSILFEYGFIYPIFWVEDNTTISYFEYYAGSIEATYAPSLMDYKLTTDLGKDHFKVKYDFTCKRCIGKTFRYRIYNMHTGIISKFEYMYNNEIDNQFEIIISNPADKVDSYTLIIPLVTLLALVVNRLVRRNRKKASYLIRGKIGAEQK